MMTATRRQFLGALGYPLGLAAVHALAPPRLIPQSLAAADSEEAFWFEVQRAFAVDRSVVNLNNGGVSPTPALAMEAMKRHLDFSNQLPAYNMWRILEPQREGVRTRLAALFGCDREEIAVTRNSSESLHICQLGMDLHEGDEVLTTNQDYPRMIQAYRQRELREGIVLKQISIPTPCEEPAEIVRRFEAAITPKTRVILCCHIINLTGQILPVRELVALGRKHDVPVIVDGAHAFAHFTFAHADLDCDYYAASLHKWLFAPIGTGLLFVRKSKIEDLWSLMPPPETLDGDIRKFEEIGTHPAANFLAIAEAITFHEGIGGKRKEERLRHLRDYWAKPLVEHDRVRLHTSLKPGLSCALATVQIDGVDSAELVDHLWERHGIFTTAIKHDEFEGIRVTPSVYTSHAELDRFVDAMTDVVKRGLPG